MQPTQWNSTILDRCHSGEKFRLINELIFPLNKTNYKYVKIGYSPFDDYKTNYILWDIKYNIQIRLTLHDIFRIHLYLSSDYSPQTTVELSSTNLFRDGKYQNLYHIEDRTSPTKLSFTEETLKTLAQSKHIYHYPTRCRNFVKKANNIIEILNNELYKPNLTEKELKDYYHEIHNKMEVQDKFFLSELIYKFPTSLMSVAKESKPY
jgi:hypothetical protein